MASVKTLAGFLCLLGVVTLLAVSGCNDPCKDYDCGHGLCDLATGAAACVCDTGYTGERCAACAAGYRDDGQGACVVVTTCGGDTIRAPRTTSAQHSRARSSVPWPRNS